MAEHEAILLNKLSVLAEKTSTLVDQSAENKMRLHVCCVHRSRMKSK